MFYHGVKTFIRQVTLRVDKIQIQSSLRASYMLRATSARSLTNPSTKACSLVGTLHLGEHGLAENVRHRNFSPVLVHLPDVHGPPRPFWSGVVEPLYALAALGVRAGLEGEAVDGLDVGGVPSAVINHQIQAVEEVDFVGVVAVGVHLRVRTHPRTRGGVRNTNLGHWFVTQHGAQYGHVHKDRCSARQSGVFNNGSISASL